MEEVGQWLTKPPTAAPEECKLASPFYGDAAANIAKWIEVNATSI